MGYGQRSAREAGAHIQRLLDLEVILLELTDPWFYHLDTCFCPLARGYALYHCCPAKISPIPATFAESA
jgi:N-dimethylarginine dimethylaminohydrolase